MKKMVEFCENNYELGSLMVKEKLDKTSQFETMEYGCLGHCIQCRITPFVMVEGKYIEDENLDLLYDKIVEQDDNHQLDFIYDLVIKTEKGLKGDN